MPKKQSDPRKGTFEYSKIDDWDWDEDSVVCYQDGVHVETFFMEDVFREMLNENAKRRPGVRTIPDAVWEGNCSENGCTGEHFDSEAEEEDDE